jgi:putative membrane protein
MFRGCAGFGYGGYGGFGGGPFMMIIPLLIIGLIVYAMYKLLNHSRDNSPRNNGEAINILMERYASGEITEEEYLSKKKLLTR